MPRSARPRPALPLKPLKIDPPSVVDDPHYAAVLQAQMNIPRGSQSSTENFLRLIFFSATGKYSK